MIRRITHVVEESPVCGRPVEIQREYPGRRVACQHCRGEFLVKENGVLAPEWVARCERLLARARRLVKTSASRLGTTAERLARASRRPSGVEDERGDLRLAARDVPKVSQRRVKPAVDRQYASDRVCHQILLVEHRDEVFARLAEDLSEVGFRVVRAGTVRGAMRYYAKQPFTLVVANLNLPDQSGWLLAAKLHLVDPTAAIWLYQPWRSGYDTAIAKFLRVEKLFAYQGDLLRLAYAVVGRLVEQSNEVCSWCEFTPIRTAGERLPSVPHKAGEEGRGTYRTHEEMSNKVSTH